MPPTQHPSTNMRDHAPRPGFTLVEMLVAMTVTLLMMAALARAFAYVGTQIQESRADTQLANSLRDITTKLQDDLGQCTVELKPNTGLEEDPNGYFLYYEGPVTDATSSLFRADNSSGTLQLKDARYGDFDDYIAFTAVAKGSQWFRGKVPRYILNRKTAELAGDAYDPANFAGEPFDAVTITSKYAEIIYFASPEYAPGSLPASPAYLDVDGDTDFGIGAATQNGLPDRVKIHRRVLLIRPDLNMNTGLYANYGGVLPPNSKTLANGSTHHFMRADDWPNANALTPTVTGTANAADGWMYGMAGVHQQCDLSVRRILAENGLPVSGGLVAANSLADLSKPHNRFAHVRAPGNLLSGGNNPYPTSMPVLALGGPATILSAVTPDSTRLAPVNTPTTATIVTPHWLSGFIRPEFVLGNDLTHINDPNDDWGLQRIGEDLVTNNALGFDVQIFDPGAALYSDNPAVSTGNLMQETVGPGDAGYRNAVQSWLNNPVDTETGRIIHETKRENGAFVDLAYPVLAGGAMRGWQPRRLDRRQATDSILPNPRRLTGIMVSPFSSIKRIFAEADGIDNNGNGSVDENNELAGPKWTYSDGLYKSGRLVTTGQNIVLFQPAFDTYTSAYEKDGFYQGMVNPNSRGSLWTTFIQGNNTVTVDRGANGLDDDLQFGVDDFNERETLAPFLNQAEAVRVTVRLENPSLRFVRQASVDYRGK
ncbi:MAG: prepilin-type N-terminal cleavage/methylation domain-containing protein [Planctomycetaceae bacterium]|nr:prepilin-type N-terminal cleavage/methylation domain-containing protein [Planctomycetaceae bacterium]